MPSAANLGGSEKANSLRGTGAIGPGTVVVVGVVVGVGVGVGVSIVVDVVDDVAEVEGTDVESIVGATLTDVAVGSLLSLAHAVGTSKTAAAAARMRQPGRLRRASILQRLHCRIPVSNSLTSSTPRELRPDLFVRSAAAGLRYSTGQHTSPTTPHDHGEPDVD